MSVHIRRHFSSGAGDPISTLQTVPDDAIHLLLRTRGRVWGASTTASQHEHRPKVSVHSILELQERMRKDSSAVKVSKVKDDQKQKASFLATFLGSLKRVHGGPTINQVTKFPITRSRQAAVREQQFKAEGAGFREQQEQGSSTAEVCKEEICGTAAVEVEVPRPETANVVEHETKQSIGSNQHGFRKPVLEVEDEDPEPEFATTETKHASASLMGMSSLAERIRKGEFRTQEQDESCKPPRISEVENFAELFPPDKRNGASFHPTIVSTTQEIPIMANSFDILDMPDMKPAGLRRIVQSFSSPEVIGGSIEVFYATRHSGFLPSSASNACLISLLLRAGRSAEARLVLGELLLEGVELGHGVFVILVDAFQRSGDLHTTYELFWQMLNRCYAPEKYTAEELLSGLSKAGMTSELHTLSRALNRDWGVSIHCCNSILDVFCRNDQLLRATELLHRMRQGACKPNRASYNCLLCHFTRSMHLKDAHNLLTMMTEDGVEPDASSYHFLVHAYCKPKLPFHQARSYFKEMKDRGLRPDAATYSCLIWGCGLRGNTNAALELFEEMKRKNVTLDVMVFNTLINTLSKWRRGKRAYLIFQEMRYRDFSPDIWTFNMLFNGLAKVEEARLGMKMFRLLKRRGLIPNVVTYTALINCLGSGGRALQAYKLHRELVSRRCECNSRTWNSLLKGLAKEDRMELAYSVYLNMLKHSSPDKVTFSVMLDLCTALRDVEKVVQLQKDMKALQIDPDEGMARILERAMKFVRKESRMPYELR